MKKLISIATITMFVNVLSLAALNTSFADHHTAKDKEAAKEKETAKDKEGTCGGCDKCKTDSCSCGKKEGKQCGGEKAEEGKCGGGMKGKEGGHCEKCEHHHAEGKDGTAAPKEAPKDAPKDAGKKAPAKPAPAPAK